MDINSESISLSELISGFKGRPLHELIRYHLNRQSQSERTKSIFGHVAMLPEEARGLVEGFIDRWNLRTHDWAFWQTDTATIFDEISEDAKNILSKINLQPDDEMLFNMFNIIVLSYAYSTYEQPNMREFIEGKTQAFPWVSASSLLYPIGASVYIATQTPAKLPMVVGYGLANLGYLLIGAGILKGTFRIFNLKRRWHVLVAGVIFFLIGTLLSNVNS